jgi:hypothetical protein
MNRKLNVVTRTLICYVRLLTTPLNVVISDGMGIVNYLYGCSVHFEIN